MDAAIPDGVFDAAIAELERKHRVELYRSDPVLWAHDFLGVNLWSMQREVLYSIRDNHNTACAAGHGVGKSLVASVAMAWWADVHPPEDTKILSTAPTQAQVSGILWDNLRRWHNVARRRYEEHMRRKKAGLDLGEYAANDHPLIGRITGDNVWKTDGGIEIGIGRKPPDNLLDSAFQGVHAPFLLVIGDEGAGLPAELVDALGNNATGSENRVLLIANPTDPNSAMARFWKQKNPDWYLMNISVLDSPTITGEAGFDIGEKDGMSGWGYINEKKRDWGEDDPRYISRVTGQWAFDSGNNVFTEQELAKAMNTIVRPDPSAPWQDGWDIARMGSDGTFGYRCVPGEVWDVDDAGEPIRRTGRQGVQVRLIDHWSKAPLVGKDPENLGSAERIDAIARGDGTPFVIVDASGIGSGTIDGLADLCVNDDGNLAYEVLEALGQSTVGVDTRRYTNWRAHIYFELKRMMHLGEIDLDPADENLIDEYRGIVYEHDTRGRIKIESKDDMKRRGVKSPDRGDATTYAVMDISPLVEGPLAGIAAGETIVADPWDLLELERASAWYPPA